MSEMAQQFIYTVSFQGQSLLKDLNEYEYFDEDETTTTEGAKRKPETKIIFGNVSKAEPRKTPPAVSVRPVPTPTRTAAFSALSTKTTTTTPYTSTTITRAIVKDTKKTQEPLMKVIPRQIPTEATTMRSELNEDVEDMPATGDYDTTQIQPPVNKTGYTLGLPNSGVDPVYNYYRRLTDARDQKPNDTKVENTATTTGKPVTNIESTTTTSMPPSTTTEGKQVCI